MSLSYSFAQHCLSVSVPGELASGVLCCPLISLTRELQQRMSVVFQFLVEFESNRPGNKRPAFLAGSNTLAFETFELGASLLPITDGVVDTEWYLLPPRNHTFLPALHHLLLIE